MKKDSSKYFLERIVNLYGDLFYDLCESVLWSPSMAPLCFRMILKEIRSEAKKACYEKYERAWVLHIAFRVLKRMSERHARRLSASEHLMMDATLNIDGRFRQFDSYLHCLTTDEQIILMLRDKFGIPYSELAAILNKPEGSIKIQRQLALDRLEAWLWEALE